MAEIVDFEARLRARLTPLERVERASRRLAAALSNRRGRRAPGWLEEGIAEVIAALNQQRLVEAADLGEELALRAEGEQAAV